MLCSKKNVKAEGLNFWSTGDLNHNGPDVDIIAVQGLGPHPYYTWVKKLEPVKSGFLQKRRAPSPKLGDTAQIADNTAEVMWLRDLLPTFVPNARIASYSYKSDWRKYVKTNLRKCAEQFLNVLHQNRLGDQERQRPLIIIAHSLGGLVVKQALVLAVHGDHFRDIRLATCGVIFLGTPHQGSSAAEYGVWLARAICSDTTLLETLKKDSPTLYGLAQDFESTYKNADIICFYEDKDSLGGIQIVDNISASLIGKRRMYLTTDHSGLNKYPSAEDENFLLVQAELCRMVQAAPETVKRQYRSYGPIVGNDFFYVPFSLEGIPEIGGKFVGRKAEIEKLAQFMLPTPTGRKSREIFLIHGIGGVGKTQLAVEFARSYQEKFSAVFWIVGNTKEKLRKSIVRLAERLPKYQLSEKARSIPKNSDEEDAVVAEVLKWFSKPSNDKWLLIFDNVDREFSAKDPQSFPIEKYFPDADQGFILITSQLADTQWLALARNNLKLEPFDERDGEILLESIVEQQLEGSLELVRLLQGLPLAIKQAGSYIKGTGSNAVTYMELYEETWDQLMERVWKFHAHALS